MNKTIRVTIFVFVLGLVSGVVFAQTGDKESVAKPVRNLMQDIELISLADYFGKYYQHADEARMNAALADGFRYYTNGPCSYKDCSSGATKNDYVAGVVNERNTNGFTVESISMRYIPPIAIPAPEQVERKVSFFCLLKIKADGNQYKVYSVIDYFFQKSNGVWKITKIENRLMDV